MGVPRDRGSDTPHFLIKSQFRIKAFHPGLLFLGCLAVQQPSFTRKDESHLIRVVEQKIRRRLGPHAAAPALYFLLLNSLFM